MQTTSKLSTTVAALLAWNALAEPIHEWKFDTPDKVTEQFQFVQDRFYQESKAISLKEGQSVWLGTDRRFSFTDGEKDLPFTVEWWQKCSTEQGKHPQLTQKPFMVLSKNGEYFIGWNNTFRVRLIYDSTNFIGITAPVEVKTGKWTHIAVSYDGSGRAEGIKVYQDGKQVEGKTENSGIYTKKAVDSGKPLLLGGRGPGDFDDLAIYNEAKSTAEVSESYRACFSVGSSPDSNRHRMEFEEQSNRKKYYIPNIQEKVVLDGILSEPYWKRGEWRKLAPFTATGVADVDTKFCFFHDNQYLYFTVVADEPFVDRIKADVSDRDGHTYVDDAIEIFIDTGSTLTPQHYHWVINSKGVVYDAIATRGAGFCRPEWNSSIECKTSVGKNHWILEGRIPLAELAFHADSPEYWSFNIGRSRKTLPERKLYSFAPVMSFHDSDSFAVTKLQELDPIFGGLDVQFKTARIYAKDGKIVGVLNFSLTNNTKSLRTIEFMTGVGNLPARKISLPPGQSSVNIPLTFDNPGRTELHMTLVDATSSKILCLRTQNADLTYSPLKMDLLRPSYRNAIFSNQRVDKLLLSAFVSVSEQEKDDYETSFVLRDREGGEICRNSYPVTNGVNTLSVKIPPLDDGDYEMSLSLVHRQSKKILSTCIAPLFKLPHVQGQVYFENGTCKIDGKTFFPYGIYPDFRTKGIWDATWMGCNTVESWGRTITPGNDAKLKAICRAGLMYMAYPYPHDVPGPKASMKEKLSSEAPEKLATHIKHIKLMPNILGWYIANEPYEDDNTVQTVKEYNRIIREADPYHPTMLVLDRANLAALYRNGTSIMGVDPYPHYLSDGSCRRPDYTWQLVNRAVRDTAGRMPVWAVLQAYDTVVFGDQSAETKGAAPDFKSMRSQLYQAVIAGAKGIFWYERGYGDIYPEIGLGIKYLSKEVELLKDAFLAEDHSGKIELLTKVIPPARRPEFSFRIVGNDYFIFLTNPTNLPIEYTFSLPEFGRDEIFVIGKKQKIPIKAGVFSLAFAPYESHALTTSENIASKVSLAEAYEEIKTANTPAYTQDNLFRTVQPQVEASWETNMKFIHLTGLPQYAVDGIRYTSFIGQNANSQQPSWISLTFPASYKISGIAIDSNIASAVIETEENGKWSKIADFRASRADLRREMIRMDFPSVRTGKIRIRIIELKSVFGMADQCTQVWEIEVFK